MDSFNHQKFAGGRRQSRHVSSALLVIGDWKVEVPVTVRSKSLLISSLPEVENSLREAQVEWMGSPSEKHGRQAKLDGGSSVSCW